MLQPPKVTKANAFMIQSSGRSWWQVQYASGKVISEWETSQGNKLLIRLPTPSASRTSRWEEIPKIGMRGLFLLCPNGKAGALEADGEYAFFQFKISQITIGGENEHYDEAHVIGKVDADDGRCVCYAWEYQEKRLVRFEDNITHLQYRNVGPLSLGHHTGVL